MLSQGFFFLLLFQFTDFYESFSFLSFIWKTAVDSYVFLFSGFIQNYLLLTLCGFHLNLSDLDRFLLSSYRFRLVSPSFRWFQVKNAL